MAKRRAEDRDRNATPPDLRGNPRFRDRPPETDCVWHHVFTCELCGRTKENSHRREEESSICIECVEEAGFDRESQ
jgi:Fe2+ or Zn2+ uptake regulation protein